MAQNKITKKFLEKILDKLVDSMSSNDAEEFIRSLLTDPKDLNKTIREVLMEALDGEIEFAMRVYEDTPDKDTMRIMEGVKKEAGAMLARLKAEGGEEDDGEEGSPGTDG